MRQKEGNLINAQLVTRNFGQLKADLRSADQYRKKAAETAAKVEGYRLMKLLKKELQAGAPGGKKLAPLQVITRGLRIRQPLAKLAKVVRYKAIRKSGKSKVSIGFLSIASSAAWIRIAKKQQVGFRYSPDSMTPSGRTTLRKYFVRAGSKMGRRSKLRKYFFLRKTTDSLDVPARPIVNPFWQAHELETARNIKTNFNRKMRGERI